MSETQPYVETDPMQLFLRGHLASFADHPYAFGMMLIVRQNGAVTFAACTTPYRSEVNPGILLIFRDVMQLRNVVHEEDMEAIREKFSRISDYEMRAHLDALELLWETYTVQSWDSNDDHEVRFVQIFTPERPATSVEEAALRFELVAAGECTAESINLTGVSEMIPANLQSRAKNLNI